MYLLMPQTCLCLGEGVLRGVVGLGMSGSVTSEAFSFT